MQKMKDRKNLFHFKGIKEEMETPEERKKRKQLEFKKQYNAYVRRREAIITKVVNEEIKEFINRPTE